MKQQTEQYQVAEVHVLDYALEHVLVGVWDVLGDAHQRVLKVARVAVQDVPVAQDHVLVDAVQKHAREDVQPKDVRAVIAGQIAVRFVRTTQELLIIKKEVFIYL